MAIRKASSRVKQQDQDDIIIRKAGSQSRSKGSGSGVVIPGWLWASVAVIIIGWMFVRFVMPTLTSSESGKKHSSKKEQLKDLKSKKSDRSKKSAPTEPEAPSMKDRLLGMFGLSDTASKKDKKKARPAIKPIADELAFVNFKHFCWPDTTGDNQLIKRMTFTLSYNEDAEQANWVAYTLTTNDVNGSAVRDNESFNPDPMVKTGSASPLDYRNSGYDRGHLIPSADRKATERQQAETFYMSNISPQVHRMNAGIWESAERRVRGWANYFGRVWVVTGPCLKPMPKLRIGDNQVAVPDKFYKIVLVLNPDRSFRMIGFVIPNEATKKSLASFVTPVDDIEDLTGIDFFPTLPDDIEDAVEADSDISLWP